MESQIIIIWIPQSEKTVLVQTSIDILGSGLGIPAGLINSWESFLNTKTGAFGIILLGFLNESNYLQVKYIFTSYGMITNNYNDEMHTLGPFPHPNQPDFYSQIPPT